MSNGMSFVWPGGSIVLSACGCTYVCVCVCVGGCGWVGVWGGMCVYVCACGCGGAIFREEASMGLQGQGRSTGTPFISRPVAIGPQQSRAPAPVPLPWQEPPLESAQVTSVAAQPCLAAVAAETVCCPRLCACSESAVSTASLLVAGQACDTKKGGLGLKGLCTRNGPKISLLLQNLISPLNCLSDSGGGGQRRGGLLLPVSTL